MAFDLTIEWIDEQIRQGRCQVTNVPFDLTLMGERNLYGPSLDRVVPEKGYTKENTKVVLFGYNACKNTASPEDTRRFFMKIAEALQ